MTHHTPTPTGTALRTFILGAPDPEMAAIERLVLAAGERAVYATMPDGSRVQSDTAYRCPVPPVRPGVTVYAVECIDVLPEGWVRIDHHRPGDPGYGRPPSEFLAASSLGRVISSLARSGAIGHDWEPRDGWPEGVRHMLAYPTPGEVRWVEDESVGWVVHTPAGWRQVPSALVLTAAADHCLGAAYRRECPGVEPDALMRWRVESRAAFQHRSVDALLADIERAREALSLAKEVTLLGVGDMEHTEDHDWSRSVCDGCAHHEVVVRDVRGQHIPELPEAAAREGVCFVGDGLPGPDGRIKVVCQSGTPEQIEAFMRVWGPAQGLRDIYGDPARGFAGGYLEPDAH